MPTKFPIWLSAEHRGANEWVNSNTTRPALAAVKVAKQHTVLNSIPSNMLQDHIHLHERHEGINECEWLQQHPVNSAALRSCA
jgi:hypothetical protein